MDIGKIGKKLVSLATAGIMAGSSYALNIPKQLATEGKTYYSAAEANTISKQILEEKYDKSGRLTKFVSIDNDDSLRTLLYSYSDEKTLEKLFIADKNNSESYFRTIFNNKGDEIEVIEDTNSDGTIDELKRIIYNHEKFLIITYSLGDNVIDVCDENGKSLCSIPFENSKISKLNTMFKKSKSKEKSIDCLLEQTTSLPQLSRD